MSDAFTRAPGPIGIRVAARLISCAARRAPPQLAERLEEEWLADLGAQRSSFAAVSFALGCCWATCVIARERGAASAALSAPGSKSFTLDPLRGPSMTRFKWLWLAVAALGVTGLVMFTAFELARHVLPFIVRHRALFAGSGGLWLSLAIGGGSIFVMIALCWRQMRARLSRLDVPRHHGPRRWTDRPLPSIASRSYGLIDVPYAALALVIAATSGLLFAASVRFVFTAMHTANTERRSSLMFVSVYFTAVGAALLVVLACAYCLHRHKKLRARTFT